MKKTHHLKRNSLILAVACAALAFGAVVPALVSGAGKAAAAAAPKSQDTGRLVIVRSPNLGSAVVGISIDGVEAGKINYNGHFDAPLPVGQHVVTVVPMHSREFAKPSETRLTVEKGKTYTFTAKQDDVRIILK